MIVIDPTTPGLNAGALVEALRQTSPRPVALVLAEDVQRVRGFGADVIHGYIRRGAESDQLVELVRDCLAALRESRPHVGRVLNPSQAARRPPFRRQTD
jgi:DNA-binding NarL/FixJ family response regulator